MTPEPGPVPPPKAGACAPLLFRGGLAVSPASIRRVAVTVDRPSGGIACSGVLVESRWMPATACELVPSPGRHAIQPTTSAEPEQPPGCEEKRSWRLDVRRQHDDMTDEPDLVEEATALAARAASPSGRTTPHEGRDVVHAMLLARAGVDRVQPTGRFVRAKRVVLRVSHSLPPRSGVLQSVGGRRHRRPERESRAPRSQDRSSSIPMRVAIVKTDHGVIGGFELVLREVGRWLRCGGPRRRRCCRSR